MNECRTCKHYHSVGESSGECRIRARQCFGLAAEVRAAWPSVEADMWCGEWVSAPDKLCTDWDKEDEE